MGSIAINSDTSSRDLGLIIDTYLSFRSHVLSVRERCYRLINFIFRTFTNTRACFYIYFFDIYIYPIISYGSLIYSCATVERINDIEKILKYFTRRLWYRCCSRDIPSYSQRLKHFKLNTLEEQRIREDLTFRFCLNRGVISIPDCQTHFSKISTHRLKVVRVTTHVAKRFFLHRSTILWNRLIHDDSFRTLSLPKFKSLLSHLNLIPLLEGRASKAFKVVCANNHHI